MIFEGADDETGFLAAATEALRALGVEASTMLCGRDVTLATPQRTLPHAQPDGHGRHARAVARACSATGLGEARKLGCGLFIPHKDVGDLRSRADQSFERRS